MGSVSRVVAIGACVVGALLALAGMFWPDASVDDWSPGGLGPRGLAIGGGLLLQVVGALGLRHGPRAARRTPETFLTASEERQVLEAIRRFESRTSGEIRVHLAPGLRRDVMTDASATFERLEMTATELRNGVLFFVAVGPRQFAVVGDRGIDAVVHDGFWDRVVGTVRSRFAAGEFAAGLCAGIELAGTAMAEYFPVAADDTDELPDEISRG